MRPRKGPNRFGLLRGRDTTTFLPKRDLSIVHGCAPFTPVFRWRCQRTVDAVPFEELNFDYHIKRKISGTDGRHPKPRRHAGKLPYAVAAKRRTSHMPARECDLLLVGRSIRTSTVEMLPARSRQGREEAYLTVRAHWQYLHSA